MIECTECGETFEDGWVATQCPAADLHRLTEEK